MPAPIKAIKGKNEVLYLSAKRPTFGNSPSIRGMERATIVDVFNNLTKAFLPLELIDLVTATAKVEQGGTAESMPKKEPTKWHQQYFV
ncbi:hypothetical protein QVD17_38815 [Tagetes erecta]|uniref:Uncharacterized protein n=1 Tax=Tagetes erecta TaxID=13708 RepID=A0AAD8JR62_TARER|nr:hypothetical protein QVD17_38815 [Tagetes erecta]